MEVFFRGDGRIFPTPSVIPSHLANKLLVVFLQSLYRCVWHPRELPDRVHHALVEVDDRNRNMIGTL